MDLALDDTSPVVLYLPFADTFGLPDLLAGWNPSYSGTGFAPAQGDIGNGTTSHLTGHDGASIAISWNGTGIQLLGNVTNASYTVTLDGAPAAANATLSGGILSDIHGLANKNHTVALTAHTAGTLTSFVSFDRAVLTVPPSDSDPASGFTPLSDTDIAFKGLWTVKNYTVPGNSGSAVTAFHTSTTSGDHALAHFSGTAVQLTGLTGPDSGGYIVTLDGVQTTLSARASFVQPTVLFVATGLDPDTLHHIEVACADPSPLALAVGGFSVLAGPPIASSSARSSSGFSTGTLVALVLAGILVSITLVGGLYLFLRRRSRRKIMQRRHPNPSVILDISPAFADPSWKGEATSGLLLRNADGGGEKPAESPDDEDEDAPAPSRAWRTPQAIRGASTDTSPSYNLDLPLPRTAPPSASSRTRHTRRASLGRLLAPHNHNRSEDDTSSRSHNGGGGGSSSSGTGSSRRARSTRGLARLLLSVRESSPFRVDFRSVTAADTPPEDAPPPTPTPAQRDSRVHFDGTSGPAAGNSGRDAFRLTPLAPPRAPQSDADDSGSGAMTSFLDLSSDVSGRSTRAPSSASASTRPALHSRWSATTAPSVAPSLPRSSTPPPLPPAPDRAPAAPSAADSSPAASSASPARSSPSGTFPFPFALSLVPPTPQPLTPPRGSHPFDTDAGASPTDSVPMSVSELDFRHTDSEGEDAAGERPAHPPLPPGPLPLIVQRVLGLPPR